MHIASGKNSAVKHFWAFLPKNIHPRFLSVWDFLKYLANLQLSGKINDLFVCFFKLCKSGDHIGNLSTWLFRNDFHLFSGSRIRVSESLLSISFRSSRFSWTIKRNVSWMAAIFSRSSFLSEPFWIFFFKFKNNPKQNDSANKATIPIKK